MTIQEIIDALNAKVEVEEAELKTNAQGGSKTGEYLSRDIHRIHYNKNEGNNVIKYKWFDVLVKDKGLATEDAGYHDKIPDILKEPENKRDNLMTENEIIADYQNKEKDKGHTVIDIRVSQHGKYDIATLRVDDTANTISRSFTIYLKDSIPEMKEMK